MKRMTRPVAFILLSRRFGLTSFLVATLLALVATPRASADAIANSSIQLQSLTITPAPHVPIAGADDLRRPPPGDLFRHRLQNHFLYLDRPLHRGLPTQPTYHFATDTVRLFS